VSLADAATTAFFRQTREGFRRRTSTWNYRNRTTYTHRQHIGLDLRCWTVHETRCLSADGQSTGRPCMRTGLGGWFRGSPLPAFAMEYPLNPLSDLGARGNTPPGKKDKGCSSQFPLYPLLMQCTNFYWLWNPNADIVGHTPSSVALCHNLSNCITICRDCCLLPLYYTRIIF